MKSDQASLPSQPEILATTVGSYSPIDWLAALPSEQAVLDATAVVIHTQQKFGIDIKVNHVETADEVASRIETAANAVGPERIGWVHPDCGLWMLKRSVADRKLEALVKGRDKYLGR